MLLLFHDMIHKKIEVYVNDIVVKSKKALNYLFHLKRLFECLYKYNLKLNPVKCAFGVTFKKLLGFLVSHGGIEINPTKIQAITIAYPQDRKGNQGLLGKSKLYQSIHISVTTTCKPIFKLLRKSSSGKWNNVCQKTFKAIKEQLLKAPILVPLRKGVLLFMYIAVSPKAMGCMLGQKDEMGKKRAIYNLSKRFGNYKQNYSIIEKTCCALAWVATRLQHYLHGHTAYLILNMNSLRYIFEKPMLNYHLSQWQLFMQQFNIIYVTQTSTKGQGIADQSAEGSIKGLEPLEIHFYGELVLTILRPSRENGDQFWKMYFDGAMNAEEVGAGAVPVSITGMQYLVAAKLCFNNSNNPT